MQLRGISLLIAYMQKYRRGNDMRIKETTALVEGLSMSRPFHPVKVKVLPRKSYSLEGAVTCTGHIRFTSDVTVQ